jgi:hypothetical protein
MTERMQVKFIHYRFDIEQSVKSDTMLHIFHHLVFGSENITFRKMAQLYVKYETYILLVGSEAITLCWVH